MDFHLLERALAQIVGPWSGCHLNDIPPFDAAVNPSAERVAERLGLLLRQAIPAVAQVRVTEAPGCAALWHA